LYKIVFAQEKYLGDATEKVEKEVNQLKKQGWTEQGGVSISRADLGGNYYVAQAMKK
jgi:hypothetical protein